MPLEHSAHLRALVGSAPHSGLDELSIKPTYRTSPGKALHPRAAGHLQLAALWRLGYSVIRKSFWVWSSHHSVLHTTRGCASVSTLEPRSRSLREGGLCSPGSGHHAHSVGLLDGCTYLGLAWQPGVACVCLVQHSSVDHLLHLFMIEVVLLWVPAPKHQGHAASFEPCRTQKVAVTILATRGQTMTTKCSTCKFLIW